LFHVPATAQSLVELDDRKELIPFDAREIQFGWKELLLGFEDFVVTGLAGDVALGGDTNGCVQGLDLAGLLLADFRGLHARDERVGHVLKGGKDGILVTQPGFFARGLALPMLAGKAAALKQRSAGVGRKRPGVGAAQRDKPIILD